MLGLLIACGGRQLEGGGGGSGGGAGGGGTAGGHYTEPDGATCVDIVPSAFGTSCTTAADCIAVSAGNLCPGYCTCGGSTINKSGQAAYEAAVAGIPIGNCECPFLGAPACVAGACAICGGPGEPPCPTDGGTTAHEASVGSGSSEAGTCVDVSLASFDQSCKKASDCAVVRTGPVCDGSCGCGNSPINRAGLAQYNKEIEGITLAECPCVLQGPVECIAEKCTVCGGSKSPPGCPDAGP